MINELQKYIDDVKFNNIHTCIEIKQAVDRFEKDLLRDDIYFNEEKANRAITFISYLKHYTGKHNNKNFTLRPWQVFIIANIFGWVSKETGLRRFNNAYIEIARKNGKTALSAAVSMYCLIADGEANAEVVLAANSREQAGYCFTAVSEFVRRFDTSQKHIKAYRNQVKFGNNIIRVIASDTTKLDGMNCSCVVLDEYHAAKTSLIYDVLKSSQGMREQPLFLIITTAGYDKKGPCYAVRTTAKEVLQGLKDDDSQFIAIYTIDDNDDYTNETIWEKSNPNLDITVKRQFLKSEVLKAKNNISLETGIKTKNFNIWCDTLTTWIGDKYIMSSSKKIEIEDIDAENGVYVGIDLSSRSDITAVSYMYIKDEKYYFINRYYLPEESLNSAADKEFYKQQHKKGNIILTPDNVVDYNYILNDILEINKEKEITKLAYDTWNSTQFAIIATENYLRIEPYSQTIANFNRPTQEFERLMLKGEIVIQENDITRWMMRNVFLRLDSNGNVKPDKSNREKKIDGVISMLMALGVYLNTPRYRITII